MIGTVRRTQANGGSSINAYGDHRNNGNGMMRTDTKKRRPDNSPSKLLTNAENQLMFEILGSQRVSLSAGVVELLRASNGKWQHVEVGVITLVKDYTRKIYTLLMFNIHTGDQLYEQVLYKNFVAKSYPNCRKLLSFESEDCVFGLNFSDEIEAADFKHHLDKRREAERDPRDNRSSMKPVPIIPAAKSQYNQQSQQNQQSNKIQSPGFTNQGSTTHIPITQHATTLITSKKKAKDQKKKKPKITKDDIGYPTDFKHEAHLGWDTDGGFNQQINTNDPFDKSVVELLKVAGQNPTNMSQEELVWAKDFVKQYEKSPIPPPIPQPSYPQSTLNRNNGVQQRNTGFTMAPINHQSHVSQVAHVPHVPNVTQVTRNQPQSHYTYQQQHSYVDQSPVPPPAPARDSSMYTAQQQRQQVPLRPPPMERPAPPMYQPMQERSYQPPSVVPQAPALPQNTSMSQLPQAPRPGPPPPPPPQLAKMSNNANNDSASVAKISSNVPPAPPPMMLNGLSNNNKTAPVSGDRSNLLAEIQRGKQLNKVGEPVEKSGFATGKAPADERGQMMNQIKQGANLKHIDADPENRKSIPNVTELGGIAGALARALHERRKNMSSDDSDDAEDNDDEWADD